MGNIKVSVLTPIYNHSLIYVRQCLDSLKAQTMQEIEFILIDNGAPDDAKRLISEYESMDSRFRVIHFAENQGYGKAMNAGLDAARGEYIGIVESDDWVEPVMYEELYKIGVKNNVEVVKSLFNFYQEGQPIRLGLTFNKKYYDCVLKNLDVPDFPCKYGAYWSAIYKKSMLVASDIRYDELPKPAAEDIMFTLKTFFFCNNLYITDKSYYYHRVDNPNSSIHTYDEKVHNTMLFYKKLEEFMESKGDKILPEYWYIKNKREFRQYYLFLINGHITKNRFSFIKKYSNLIKDNIRKKRVLFDEIEKERYVNIAFHPILFYLNLKIKSKYERLDCRITSYFFGLIKKITKDHTREYYVCGLKLFKLGKIKKSQIIKKEETPTHDVYTIFKIKIKKRNKEKFRHCYYYDIQKSNIEAAAMHPKIFSKYKNLYENRDIAIVGCGPTATYYTPIENVTHIGVNRAFKLPQVDLDYLFVQDFMDEEDMVAADNYLPEKCKKFYALISDLRASQVFPKIKRIPLYHVIAAKAEQYVLKSCSEYVFPFDLSYTPFSDIGGTALSAMQFALYTNPRKIYLIGCDCSNNGHFHVEAQNGNGPKFKSFIRWWRYLKKYLQDYNYRTEIISVNPVGLKGMFKDVYTQNYIGEHPDLLNKNIIILDNGHEINKNIPVKSKWGN